MPTTADRMEEDKRNDVVIMHLPSLFISDSTILSTVQSPPSLSSLLLLSTATNNQQSLSLPLLPQQQRRRQQEQHTDTSNDKNTVLAAMHRNDTTIASLVSSSSSVQVATQNKTKKNKIMHGIERTWKRRKQQQKLQISKYNTTINNQKQSYQRLQHPQQQRSNITKKFVRRKCKMRSLDSIP